MRRSLMAVVALIVLVVAGGSAQAQCVGGVCHLKQGGMAVAPATESYAGPSHTETAPLGFPVTYSQPSGGGMVPGSVVSSSIYEATAGGAAPMAATSNALPSRCGMTQAAPAPQPYYGSGRSCASNKSYAPAYSQFAPTCNGGRVRHNRCR